jgi:ADP-heptose:LPS heptosyltransferase
MSMNVLIVRPDGIGDMLLSIPVATQLRRKNWVSRQSNDSASS